MKKIVSIIFVALSNGFFVLAEVSLAAWALYFFFGIAPAQAILKEVMTATCGLMIANRQVAIVKKIRGKYAHKIAALVGEKWYATILVEYIIFVSAFLSFSFLFYTGVNCVAVVLHIIPLHKLGLVLLGSFVWSIFFAWISMFLLEQLKYAMPKLILFARTKIKKNV